MSSNWQSFTIEEIAAKQDSSISIGPFGSRMKSDCYVAKGIPVIRGNNISEGLYPEGEFVFVDEDKAREVRSAQVYGGDLVFPHRGAIGRVALVRDSTHMILSSSLMKLTPDKERCSSKFLFYFFRSKNGIYELLKNASTVGTPGIGQPLTSLKSIPVLLPPLQEQKAIAHILVTLDEKIELNRKTNETLEGIAKALFKSWFIDCDPVRAKAEGRSTGLPDEISELFPDSFEDSEWGDIPTDWKMTCLDELTDFVIGGDWGKEKISDEFPSEVLCIRGADIPDLQQFGYGKMPTRFLKSSSFSKRSLKDADIVFEISGGSPTQSTGRPVLIEKGLLERCQIPLACSNFCRIIRPQNKELSFFIYYFLKDLYDKDEMFMYETGTTGIKNFGYKYFASSRKFLIPNQELLSTFSGFIKAIRNTSNNRGTQSGTLRQIRDALLPKLISGELRVPDVENMLEEVGI